MKKHEWRSKWIEFFEILVLREKYLLKKFIEVLDFLN